MSRNWSHGWNFTLFRLSISHSFGKTVYVVLIMAFRSKLWHCVVGKYKPQDPDKEEHTLRKENAIEMQIKLAHEAAMMLRFTGSKHDTQFFEHTIRLIGKAWSLTEEDTEKSLLLIHKEREAMMELEKGNKADHILPEDELYEGWSGRECVKVIKGLFETAIRLDSAEERTALYNMAMESAEIQTLDDCIVLTDREMDAEDAARAEMVD